MTSPGTTLICEPLVQDEQCAQCLRCVDADFVGTAAASCNGLSLTVASKTTNTFALLLDSTGLTYTSGGAAPVPILLAHWEWLCRTRSR